MKKNNLPLKEHLLVHHREILREEYMQPRGITVTELAKGFQ